MFVLCTCSVSFQDKPKEKKEKKVEIKAELDTLRTQQKELIKELKKALEDGANAPQ